MGVFPLFAFFFSLPECWDPLWFVLFLCSRCPRPPPSWVRTIWLLARQFLPTTSRSHPGKPETFTLKRGICPHNLELEHAHFFAAPRCVRVSFSCRLRTLLVVSPTGARPALLSPPWSPVGFWSCYPLRFASPSLAFLRIRFREFF